MTRRPANTELWAGGAAAGLLVLQVVVFGAGLWLSILLAVALYVGIVLTLPNATPANPPQNEEQVAFEAAVDHLGSIRRLETHVRGPDVHEQVQRIGDRVSQTLQVMREDGMLAAARPFNEHLLEPYVVLLNEYVRLSSRDVKSAGELLRKAETHDFPIIEAAIDSFYEKLNRGNIVDLATQAEMLSLHIESLELSPPLEVEAMNVKQRVGAVILVVTTLLVVIASRNPGPPNPEITVVQGYGGALKVNFLKDPDVAAILKDRYGLQVEIWEAGSIEMLCDLPLDDKDFIWAGDQSSLAIYRDCGGTAERSDNIYNSPVVLYSWTPIVDALVAAGIAREEPGGAYSIDFGQLVALISEGRTWTDVGVDELHGKITVHTTDPSRSNSGYLFAGLLANSMNGGSVVNETTIGPLLPGIRSMFDQLGFMEATSGDLFEQFLTTGMGAKPIVAGYESQLLEFVIANPAHRDQVNEQVRILYPRPTVWASHPMVARTEDGVRLIDALLDPEIQQLAWERHGHRTGVPNVINDPEAIEVTGLMKNVASVVDMPAPPVMNRILTAVTAAPEDTGVFVRGPDDVNRRRMRSRQFGSGVRPGTDPFG